MLTKNKVLFDTSINDIHNTIHCVSGISKKNEKIDY